MHSFTTVRLQKCCISLSDIWLSTKNRTGKQPIKFCNCGCLPCGSTPHRHMTKTDMKGEKMSTDYDLVCIDCKKKIETIASGSIAYGNKLWRAKEYLDKLRDFLFEHCGHKLIFADEEQSAQLFENEDEEKGEV